MQYSIDIRYGKFLKTPKGGQTLKSGQALKSSPTALSFKWSVRTSGRDSLSGEARQLMKQDNRRIVVADESGQAMKRGNPKYFSQRHSQLLPKLVSFIYWSEIFYLFTFFS